MRKAGYEVIVEPITEGLEIKVDLCQCFALIRWNLTTTRSLDHKEWSLLTELGVAPEH